MAHIDLDRISPERVLDETDPQELVAAVEALGSWTPRRLALVDDVLTGWTADYIARPNDRDGLMSLQRAILRILGSEASAKAGMQTPEEKSAPDYARRWEGLSDSLAARDITLADQNPERVRSLRHVAEIEAIVAEAGEIGQGELQQRCQLKSSRLSQVLALMEAHGLINRRSAGRDKYVSLAHTPAEKKKTEPAKKGSGMSRGIDYLTRKKVA